jgi:hypothetical protein
VTDNIQGYIVMESTMEPMKPKIIKTVNEPGMFFVSFEACLQSFDVFNRNNRNYGLKPMKEAINADHIQELMRKGTWVGENGHPDSQDMKRILTVDPTKICHRICDVEFRGNLLYARIETLNDDAYGKQFTKHILQGLHPSFSLRALAAIKKLSNGKGLIETKPHIITYDRVILPSHKEAYMDASVPVTLVRSATESAVTTEGFVPAAGNTFADKLTAIKETAIPEVLSYVKEESQNYKDLVTFFNSNDEKVSLVNESTVLVQGENEKLIVNLEDYIEKDIRDYFKSLNDKLN